MTTETLRHQKGQPTGGQFAAKPAAAPAIALTDDHAEGPGLVVDAPADAAAKFYGTVDALREIGATGTVTGAEHTDSASFTDSRDGRTYNVEYDRYVSVSTYTQRDEDISTAMFGHATPAILKDCLDGTRRDCIVDDGLAAAAAQVGMAGVFEYADVNDEDGTVMLTAAFDDGEVLFTSTGDELDITAKDGRPIPWSRGHRALLEVTGRGPLPPTTVEEASFRVQAMADKVKEYMAAELAK